MYTATGTPRRFSTVSAPSTASVTTAGRPAAARDQNRIAIPLPIRTYESVADCRAAPTSRSLVSER